MKKIIAMVLLLILTMGVLVACNQVVPTEKKARWDDTESWTYDISLANFGNSLTTTQATYFQDFLYSGETNPYTGSSDRIAPQELEGQYVVTVKKDTTNTTVSTQQTMYATYETISPDTFSGLDHCIEKTTDTSVTLKSTTETRTVFKTGSSQTPVSSYIKVDGFYVGRQHQGLSAYEISTEYKVGSKNTTATVTRDGKETEYEIAGTNVIDNNQVLMFVRSFDKTSTGFQDNPQVMVFDPLTAQTRRLTFVYNASQNFMVEHKFADATETAQIATIVNRLDVLLDGLPLMTQVSLPDLTEKGLDQVSTDLWNVYLPKHTICRFRVGFVSYQLTGYLTDEMVKAIQVKAE